MKRIAKSLEKIKKVEEKALVMIDKDVDRIIKSNIQEVSIIEPLLDVLLGFTIVDSSNTFNKLNTYYESFNPEYSEEYRLIYNDIKKDK